MEDVDLRINTKIGDFIFSPTFIIKDKSKNPFLYLRFNRKEKLALYHKNDHPESKNAAEKFKKEFLVVTEQYGEKWIVSDVMDYIEEIVNILKLDKAKLDDLGIIQMYIKKGEKNEVQ